MSPAEALTGGPTTGRERLQISSLSMGQKELMGDDVDIDSMILQLKGKVGIQIADNIVAAEVERTIEGASTLSVTIVDQDRLLLKSGRLADKVDVKVDGLWFRLVQVNKQEKLVTLIFEDREIAVLRTYDKKKGPINRTKITRAQFILSMIREVKEFNIPWVIPELKETQPIEKEEDQADSSWDDYNRSTGVNNKAQITVKGVPPSDEQRRNIKAVLDAAGPIKRKLMVCAIMAAIQESSILNLLENVERIPGGHYGVFQQDPRYWPASGDVATDARAFYERAVYYNNKYPNLPYYQLIEMVQRSGLPELYAQWRTEAERIVTNYGVPPYGASAANNQGDWDKEAGDYQYYRGIPPSDGSKKWEKENSWDCIQRLSDEVNWRAFFVSGTFYYMSEPRLFQSKPRMIIDESSPGIDWINFDYDQGKETAEVLVQCRMGRWDAPMGSVVQIKNMGPVNGRWLVTGAKRSLFDSSGEITLKKPRPKLPEPFSNDPGSEEGDRWDQPTDDTDGGGGKVIPPLASGRVAMAKRILEFYRLGRYFDDNGHQISQIQRTADGLMLRPGVLAGGQCAPDVYLSENTLGAILILLENGFLVGTFALAEDHYCGTQHAQGRAVDISSLGILATGRYVLNTYSAAATEVAKQGMKMLAPPNYQVWDLICNGVGRYDSSVQALQYDNGRPRGGIWEGDHTNHIHWGL
jgi:hypothetical protein